MPKVSEFYGISIYLYYRDHNPPHFHAFYGDSEAQVGINAPVVLAGSLPPRAFGLVAEWAVQRRAELLRAWMQASSGLPIESIEPL